MDDMGYTRGASFLDGAAAALADGWPAPQPLIASIEREPYPMDALPGRIAAAVEEVAGFVKAPLPMVAASALAAVSVAVQAHADVRRTAKLESPSSLYLLTIADSGERKSTCDGFFTKPIREYQTQQAELMQPEIERHNAEHATWKAKREGLLAAVKDAAKKGEPIAELQAELVSHERNEPHAPRVPKLILGDETPESLAWGLAHRWPSAAVISSEAGVVLGAHGMNRDNAMRNLALLNVMWENGTHDVGRRTSESFTLKGARLTVALQVQEATLRGFFDRTGALARGTGFLARFLVAWPESTQGTRFFTEAPDTWPRVAAMHRRLSELLNDPVHMSPQGELLPVMLNLSGEAKAAWCAYHDAIEAELGSGRDLYDVRDVASKSADNAARLAALFHAFENGTGGAISLDAMQRASRIAAWHLSEARRFFGEIALPVEQANAVRLDRWLIEHCRRKQTHFVSTREAQRHGSVRDKDAYASAVRELEELDRVRQVQEGRRKNLRVNPALIGGAP